MWQLSWPLSEEKAFQLMNSANPNISSPTHTETCGAHTAENKQKYDQHTHGSGSVLLAEALRLCAGWHEPLVNMLKRTHPNNITGHPTYDRDPHQPCEASPPHPTRCLSTHNSTNTCMNSNIFYSLIFHSAMIILTALSLPFMMREPIDLPPIVSVELIQISDKTKIPFAPKAAKILEKIKKEEERIVSEQAPPSEKKRKNQIEFLCQMI